MADKKISPCASGTIPLPGLPDSREFREVDPEFIGRCVVDFVGDAAYRNEGGTQIRLCAEGYKKYFIHNDQLPVQ